MEKILTDAVVKLPAHKTEVFRGVLEQLRWFAGKQVKSVAVSPAQGLQGLSLQAGPDLLSGQPMVVFDHDQGAGGMQVPGSCCRDSDLVRLVFVMKTVGPLPTQARLDGPHH